MIMAKPPVYRWQDYAQVDQPQVIAPSSAAAQGVSMNTMPPGLAGAYAFDDERTKKLKELFGNKDLDSLSKMLLYTDIMNREQNDKQNMQDMLDVFGPYFKDVARENQRLGMEANVFKTLLDAPKEFQRAMAEKYRFFGDQLGMLRENAGAPSYVTRQYIDL